MRWVELDGCGHFRDVGGYPTTDGLRTKWGLLYRSGSLDTLSSSGLSDLRDLGVRTIVDLRMDDERVSPPTWNHDNSIDVVTLPSPNPAVTSLHAGSYDAAALYVAAIDDRARQLPVVMSILADSGRLPVVMAAAAERTAPGWSWLWLSASSESLSNPSSTTTRSAMSS